MELKASRAHGQKAQTCSINGDFSKGLQGWRVTPCFKLDPISGASGGKASLKIVDPAGCERGVSIAVNEFVPAEGIYTVGGDIKTSEMTPEKRFGGARIDLFWAGGTKMINGTHDWQTYTFEHAVVAPPAGKSRFRLEIYGKVSGTAWFRDLFLRRESPPLVQTFMLYPNYRGYLFPGSDQQVRMQVTLNLDGADAMVKRGDLSFRLEALNSESKSVAAQVSRSPADNFTSMLDFAALPAGVYRVRGQLLSGGKTLFEPPAYKVVKVDSNPGTFLRAWIDERNRAHFGDGAAHYVLGIYETSGYSNNPKAFDKPLDEIAQAPLNMLINYYITNAPTSAIDAYTDGLQSRGIFFMPAVNDFYSDNHNYPKGLASHLGSSNDDDFVARYTSAFKSNKGIVGYYVQDEPMLDKLPRTFHQFQVIKESDPAGFDLVVLSRYRDLGFWKDAADVMGVDPYPLWKPAGNDIAMVGDRTRAAVESVHGARPVWTVIQFFQGTLESAWPTEQQLHDMSWMAVAEGASGLFYWSHGLRGLASVRDPIQKKALWQELVNVTKEVKEMEPMLLQPDTPVLAGDPPKDIVVRSKVGADGTRYLIAYNHSADATQAKFTLKTKAQSVTVRRGMQKLTPGADNSFADKFAGYEAKVYEIR